MIASHLTLFVAHYGYPFLFISSAIEGTGLPGPVELLFFAAGYLVAHGDMTWHGVWVVMTMGNLVGNLIGYLLGLWGGRRLFDWVVARLRLSDVGVARAERWFHQYGGISQMLSRWIGFTRTPAVIGAGVLRAPLVPFLFWSLVGDAAWSLVWTLVGIGIGRDLPLHLMRAGWWLAGLGLVAIAWYAVRALRRRVVG